MSKSKKIRDPYAKREANKYEYPIPSREYILEFLHEAGKPTTRGTLIDALRLTTEVEQEALRRRLRAMERDGQIVFTRKGGYALPDKMGLVSGRVIGHKDGFGFLVPDDEGEDIFLNAKQMRALFHGDKILVRVSHVDKKGRREGELVQVLERANTHLVGRYFFEGGIGFVTPENKRITQDIIIPDIKNIEVKHGNMVVVDIVSPPTFRTQAIGQITEVLGEHMAPGMEIDVAIRSHSLPSVWSEEALDQAQKFGKNINPEAINKRKDLRNKPFVTIDGEDAKDFDDAVYCEKAPNGGGWILYVAIADVSYYVQSNTPLDKEAFERATSVYFPGRVIPMLPTQLSNELCSLKPNKDRLVMVCEMAVSSKGTVTRYRFYDAVIHSQARMTYTNVYKILVEKDKKLQKQYQALVPHFKNLYALYLVLYKERQLRGALDFDTVETEIIFGPNKKIKSIIARERNDAHRLIEECMLLANVSASKFLVKHKIPTLYRVHEGPPEEKLADVRSFLAELGLSLKGGDNPKPKDYAELLRKVNGRADGQMIQTVLLRSLSQAIYTPENKGHFGLAYDCYAHFTSPIRRYPDLLVHRAIRYGLYKKETSGFFYSMSDMMHFGEHCSLNERRADDATRDVTDWLKCEYMHDKVGEEYEGIITGITHFGIFVQLQKIFVEGLVHISELPGDYYQYDPKRHRLLGERTRKMYRLTDKLRVKVARVNLEDRQIDFVLVK